MKRGRAIATNRAAQNLDFSENISDLEGGYDIFLASGSFQYLEDPLTLVLERLKNKPKHFLVNMLPVHKNAEFVTLQSIGTAYCPYKIFHEDAFNERMEKFGYRKIADWINPEKECFIPFHEEASVKGYKGMLYELNAPNT